MTHELYCNDILRDTRNTIKVSTARWLRDSVELPPIVYTGLECVNMGFLLIVIKCIKLLKLVIVNIVIKFRISY